MVPSKSALTGYLHPAYASSFAALGVPRELAASGGWLIERHIPGGDRERDAMGCYPLFVCQNWSGLEHDCEEIGGDLVAVSLVSDPFGQYTAEQLRAAFPDVCRPFKEHFVVDYTRPLQSPSAGHRRNLRLAQGLVEVEMVVDPIRLSSDWVSLYQCLVERHEIRGIPAFSPASLVQQLNVPGLTMFRAVHREQTVGITAWYASENAAYYHLGAYSKIGYAVRASFALFDHAIRHFRGRVRRILLGAGAGANANSLDGLTRFKRGWANGTHTAWLCGRIFNLDRYNQLAAKQRLASPNYFPVYRAGEFS
jgi:hypothetical protein